MNAVVDNAIVETRCGKLRGAVADGVYVFKGVPYAAAPVGGNRFRPPQPVEAWSGVRDALAFGAKPLQMSAPPDIAAMVPDPSVVGDDCLNLNIWSPSLGDSRLPVMVWIPGGTFEVGSGATYDGSRFARDGVVCVTINYRVGAEGFLYLERGNPNLGLLDQIAALEWVRDNIAAFGGDRQRDDLRRVGGRHEHRITARDAARAICFAARSCKAAGRTRSCRPRPHERFASFLEEARRQGTRQAIAAVPAERILAAQTELKNDIIARPDPARWGNEVVATMMPFHPVVDGACFLRDRSIASPPVRALRSTSSPAPTRMTGSCSS